MGNAMFHKGSLKTYDSISQTGTIYLAESQLELHFSVSDLPNSSIPPQIGERVKCFINDGELESKTKAKFIVRLDHKNSRTDKPLNQIFYSEEEDQKALSEKEKLKAELSLDIEKRQREIENEVKNRLEIELAQAKKELLLQIEELKNNNQSFQQLIKSNDSVRFSSLEFGQTSEHDAKQDLKLKNNLDQPITQNIDSKSIPVLDQSKVIESSVKPIEANGGDLENSSFSPEKLSSLQITTPEVLKSTDENRALAEIELLQNSTLNDANNLKPEAESQTIIGFENVIQTLYEIPENNQLPKTQVNHIISPLSHDQFETVNRDHNHKMYKNENLGSEIPNVPKLSEVIENVHAELPQDQAIDEHSENLHSEAERQATINNNATDSEKIMNQENNKSMPMANVSEQPKSINAHQSGSTLDKIKTKLEYSAPQQRLKRKRTQKQLNPWVMGIVLAIFLCAGIGYLAVIKYQEYKQDKEVKARLYLLEQQRLIEEQRQQMGKISNKKVLSEKTLDELLGKDRKN